MTPSADEGKSRRDMFRMSGTAVAGAAAATAASAISGVGLPPASAEPLAPLFLPVGPYRLYDSRNGDGPISGEEEVVFNAHPQPFEVAYLLNITVTGTTGAGWLALYPGDQTWPGHSNINWFGNNQNIANNALSYLGQDDTLAIRCGGSSTHFIFDLTGVLQWTDLASSALAIDRASSNPGHASRTVTMISKGVDK